MCNVNRNATGKMCLNYKKSTLINLLIDILIELKKFNLNLWEPH